MRNIIITYDIVDDKRRTNLFKTLQGYGISVQFSVFECQISEVDLIQMKYSVESIINRNEDSVIYYDLCPRCNKKIKRTGIRKRYIPEDIVVV